MNLWLSPEVLSWNRNALNPKTYQGWDFLKPYKLLQHAKKRLDEVNEIGNPNQENLALGDSVYHLRGAIEHREKQLIERFNLSKLPIEQLAQKKVYEKLHQLGIIQPVLLKKLINLRNSVTHEQKFPLSTDKSAISELWEFVWYFIRSTDSFLARDISGIIFYPPDFSEPKPRDWEFDESDEYKGCFLVTISPNDKWQVSIRGSGVPMSLFSKNEKEHWFQLIVNRFDDFLVDEELGPNIYDQIFAHPFDPFEEIPSDAMDARREKRFDKYSSSSEDIKHFEGTLTGPPAALRFMINEYFELYMFY